MLGGGKSNIAPYEKEHSSMSTCIKTTHGKMENWSSFTDGLYLEDRFQRLNTYIHVRLRRKA